MTKQKNITCERPETVRIDKYSVYVATNVTEVEVQDDIMDEESETPKSHIEYHFDEYRYDKDEYIKLKLAEQEEGILELADIIGGML